MLLRAAAKDGFEGVDEPDLGAKLHGLAKQCSIENEQEWGMFVSALERFDGLGRQDRAILVAKGMRLCASVSKTATPSRPAAKVETKRPSPMPTAVVDVDDESPRPAVLAEPIEVLPGIGKATAAKLRARGLESVVDLAYVLPAAYHDLRSRKPLEAMNDGEIAVFEARIGSVRQGFARGKFMATVQLEATLENGQTASVVARWFHRVGGMDRWSRGGQVLVVGPVRHFRDQLTLTHPELRELDDAELGIEVRYPALEGIAPKTAHKAIAAAVARLDVPSSGFVDALPPELAETAGFPTQLQALRRLHCPAPDLPPDAVEQLQSATSIAHRRLAFDEFFFIQLALLVERGQARAHPARLRPVADAFSPERLRACLPFELTSAQRRVLDEIETDMAAGPPMMRLLQGDVGSGKTAVAFGVAMAVVHSGGQAALMAPTEILAGQHLRTLQPWCERAGVRIGLLTGATAKGQRASMIALLEAGSIDLIVGTHALLTDDVRFANLGLVIIDEQHRFGVEQRALLRRKGEQPHLLVMTATPIPRTTALCAYGELEVSIIDELPPGREPPETRLLTGKTGLQKIRAGITRRVAAGDQVFVVCPLVEASERLDVTDVEATADALRQLMPETEIAVVHGRMTSKDKDEVMTRFRGGQARVLVATTVIEVGVDIPTARLMVIEHAERFGLAQLHQLRGRVGRGGGTSWCLLHTGARRGSDVHQRLSVMTETTDGFVIAERDLAFRGPGEVFGTRQAGAPRLRFAGFAGEGTKLIVAARDAAQALLERDPGLRGFPEVRAELARRQVGTAVIAADAG